jgi:DNA polymerase-3 subunit gamma/tau
MQTLGDLKGQPLASRILTYYLKHPIPPLMIFSGPDGTGRWSAARAFIKQRLCKVGTGCGTCIPCRKLDREEYYDLIEFPPDKKVLIGDQEKPEDHTIRWLLQNWVKYTPYEGPIRFVLFPQGDLIQHEAETALLKTLEEPPEHTRFIILIRKPEELKETILSRGVLVPFQHLPASVMESLTGNDDRDFLDVLGGSVHLAPFFATELFRRMHPAIKDSFSHPLNMLDLEKWIFSGEKNSFSDLTEGQDFSYQEILDIFSLLFLQASQEHKQRRKLQNAIFEFKRDLHMEQQGMNPYLISRLFHKITLILEKP